EDLAALGILTTLAVLDVGPFGMTSHNSLHLVYEFSSEPLPARQSSVALARTAAAVRCRCAPRTAKPGFHRASQGLLLRLGLFAQADMQFAKRLAVHDTRRLGHDTGRTLGFREGDHLADGGCAGHQHDQAIQTEGQA